MENNDKKYEYIMLTTYDPNNSLFKSTSKDYSSYTLYSCCNCDNCNAFKRNKCALRSGLWGNYCPYGKVSTNQGFTKRSKKCSSFIYEAKNLYTPQIRGNNNLESLNFTCEIGEYVYIDLPHLHNYSNSIDKELGIEHEHFIPKEKFDFELVDKLLNYHPQALFGGEITNYQKKNIPQFIIQLKRYFPKLYKEVVKKHPQYQDLFSKINYVKKQAKVTTLLPSEVCLTCSMNNHLQWDGEKLSGKAKNLISFTDLDKDTMIYIYPTDKDYVYICENDSVTEETEFLNE